MPNGVASNTKQYNGTCTKCSLPYQRDIRVDDETVLNDPHLTDQEKAAMFTSNTEKVFCPDCITKFIKWMSDKHYLATDCWCSHIKEYELEIE